MAAALLLALPLEAPRGASASEGGIVWRPGYGVVVPGGLWAAADATVSGEVPDGGSSVLELDNMSLLLRWEPTARLAFFTEIRLDDLVSWQEGGTLTTDDARISVERLYTEALLTPALTLRLGKVFTPYGLWNVVRRAPLTWTVNRPAITENVFPQHATGLSLLYQTTWRGWSVDATAYGPAQDELSFSQTDEGDLNEEGLLFGERVAVGHVVGPAYAALGVNALGYRPRGWSDWTTVTGIDLDVAWARHQVMGEATVHLPPGRARMTQGLYLQDVIALDGLVPRVSELYAVLRFEQLQPPHGRSAVGGLVGAFWRPVPMLVLRCDYFFASRTVSDFEPGLHGSVSVLF